MTRVPILRLHHLSKRPEDATPEEIRAVVTEVLWTRPVSARAETGLSADLNDLTTTPGGDPVPDGR